MYLWVFIFILTSNLAGNLCCEEDVFETLYKSNEPSHATVCSVSSDSVCRGLLWRKDGMLIHASCALNFPLQSIYTKKGVDQCSREGLSTVPTNGNLCKQEVAARYTHPLYPKVDLALLVLSRMYNESFENFTINDHILTKLEDWVISILKTETANNETVDQRGALYYTVSGKYIVPLFVLCLQIFAIFFYCCRIPPEVYYLKLQQKIQKTDYSV